MAVLKIQEKVKASTLLEVIVAMVVILIVFAMSTAIYLNVIKTAPSVRTQQLGAVATGLMQMEHQQEEESVLIDSIVYEKKLLPYPGYPDLQLMEIRALQEGIELMKVSKLIRLKDDE